MTPGARIQTAIVLLDHIHGGMPAEQALTAWARRSRFAGSKDRAAVRDHVFQALRCWRSYARLGGANTGRGVMIGAMRAAGEDLSMIFNGQGYGAAPLSDEEDKFSGSLQAIGDKWDLPDWIIPLFMNSLCDDAEVTALALRDRAPVILRVNLRKASLEHAVSVLAQDDVVAIPDPNVITALHVTGGMRRIAGSDAYISGLVELQDGSSQAAMNLLTVAAGAKVLDYCAGGGGKVLALAARAEAQWFAHDALPQRMRDLPQRALRADVMVNTLETAQLEKNGYDLVLCDVPCSGSGTWRRSPDAKWRFTQDKLTDLGETQDEILDAAAALVNAGGQLVYATCSVLREENEDRIIAFLQRNSRWRIGFQRRWSVSDAGDGFFLTQLLGEWGVSSQP